MTNWNVLFLYSSINNISDSTKVNFRYFYIIVQFLKESKPIVYSHDYFKTAVFIQSGTGKISAKLYVMQSWKSIIIAIPQIPQDI